jgi:signal transduction histidine kinase
MDLVDFVGARCEEAAALAPLKQLNLRFVCTMERHISAVNSDALRGILGHLLSNAFKFTPAGGTITVELRASHGRILLSVTDTGCGISEEKLQTLFDRYLHENLMDPRPHGLGLGLPLCRRIAEGHGGILLAESKVGEGSCFTFRMPKRRAENSTVSDVPLEYRGGFNPTLLALADALPARVFRLRNQ